MGIATAFLRMTPDVLMNGQQYRWLSDKIKPKTTGLYNFHKSRNARLEPFAGFLMPMVYKGQTVTSEHLRTRQTASVFDVSHMMQTVIRGKDRVKFMESLTVADLEGLSLDRCTLSVFTNNVGGILDDCIVGQRQNHLHVVSNASNAETIWSLMKSKSSSYDVELCRLEKKCLIALQGPSSSEVLQPLMNTDLSTLKFMSVLDAELTHVGRCQITRCGYTGEDGFEISLDAEQAEPLTELLCDREGVGLAGLGARNTLRLEAGLCLHGHDISDKTTPVEGALNWVIAKRRRLEGGFPGFEVIRRQLEKNSEIKRSGLVASKGGPPAREGCQILDHDMKTSLGYVTSGSFAPSLMKNIAMAYLRTDVSKEIGRKVFCQVRGKSLEYEVTKMPFVQTKYYTQKV